MKVVILAGGYGTRISEESGVRPKPMVEIGGYPILWHIMKIYSAYGLNDFVICLGYKGHIIKEYFANYFLYNSDVSFNMKNNSMKVHSMNSEPWNVTLVNTGEETMTGGRLKKIQKYVDGETFCMTYGDGVSNININDLIMHHENTGVIATVTSVRQHGRYGVFQLKKGESIIDYFKEKPEMDGDETAWINGGFFVLEPKVFDYIEGDNTVFERDSLEKLASEKQLAAFRHTGFWQPMDTLRDKHLLEELWSKSAPWKVWENGTNKNTNF